MNVRGDALNGRPHGRWPIKLDRQEATYLAQTLASPKTPP